MLVRWEGLEDESIAYADAPVPLGKLAGAPTPDGPTGYGATGLA